MHTTTTFTFRDPDARTKVRSSFNGQTAMKLVGANITRIDPGEVEIELPYSPQTTQQHGFLHGGVIGMALDTACGFASLSLMPADVGVLTVEYKLNFLAPGQGEKFQMIGRVRKAGRTLMVAQGDAYAWTAGNARLVATMTATMMCIADRTDVKN